MFKPFLNENLGSQQHIFYLTTKLWTHWLVQNTIEFNILEMLEKLIMYKVYPGHPASSKRPIVC